MNLLMIRHGEIPSNINRVYAGKSTESLTEKGIDQARRVSEKLKRHKIDALYSSPVQRALQTSRIIAEETGLTLQVDEAFREMELGPWEGMSETDVQKKYPDEWNIWNSRPAELKMSGRESLDELLSRVLNGIRGIRADNADNIAIITHVAIIRVMLLWHANRSLNFYKTIDVPNTEIFLIGVDNNQLRR